MGMFPSHNKKIASGSRLIDLKPDPIFSDPLVPVVASTVVDESDDRGVVLESNGVGKPLPASDATTLAASNLELRPVTSGWASDGGGEGETVEGSGAVANVFASQFHADIISPSSDLVHSDGATTRMAPSGSFCSDRRVVPFILRAVARRGRLTDVQVPRCSRPVDLDAIMQRDAGESYPLQGATTVTSSASAASRCDHCAARDYLVNGFGNTTASLPITGPARPSHTTSVD